MPMLLSELKSIVNGRHIGADISFDSVSIDSRTLEPGELFIALVGERFDGNQFIVQAKNQGASAALANQDFSDELPVVVVDDTRLALGQLARVWRRNANPFVIGITGSNGKTTTKELIAAVFGVSKSVLCTHGNFNNDIGVPLTLLRLNETHEIAVVEMGANHPGEIDYTSRIAEPDIALITNAGEAHLEGFGSIEGVACTKGEMIDVVPRNGTVVLNADDPFFGFWKEKAMQRRVISFGFSCEAEIRAEKSSIEKLPDSGGTRFQVETPSEKFSLSLKLLGNHNVLNALAATSVGIAAGLSADQISVGLASVHPVNGRMQIFRGIGGATVINDSYNANPSSLKVALDVLTDYKGRLWLILGAFAEMGEQSLRFHEEIGQDARNVGVERLFAVGPDTQKAVEAFGKGGCYFKHQRELISAAKDSIDHDVVILIKGSCSQHMDVVASALAETGTAR